MPSHQRKNKAKQRANYFQTQDDVLESAGHAAKQSLKRNGPLNAKGIEQSQKRNRPRIEPEKKRSAKRESYQAELEKKCAAKWQQYWESPESDRVVKRV